MANQNVNTYFTTENVLQIMRSLKFNYRVTKPHLGGYSVQHIKNSFAEHFNLPLPMTHRHQRLLTNKLTEMYAENLIYMTNQKNKVLNLKRRLAIVG